MLSVRLSLTSLSHRPSRQQDQSDPVTDNGPPSFGRSVGHPTILVFSATLRPRAKVTLGRPIGPPRLHVFPLATPVIGLDIPSIPLRPDHSTILGLRTLPFHLSEHQVPGPSSQLPAPRFQVPRPRPKIFKAPLRASANTLGLSTFASVRTVHTVVVLFVCPYRYSHPHPHPHAPSRTLTHLASPRSLPLASLADQYVPAATYSRTAE